MFLLILAALLAIYFVYIKIVVPQRYWKEQGVKHEKPMFLFGNVFKSIMRRDAIANVVRDVYLKFRDERYFGFYQFTNRALIINDLELIKKLGIKDFDSFPDHPGFSTEEIDPLWSKNLFSSQGEKWREMRPTLSPLFTSSKMKMMFNLVAECAEQFTNHFLEEKDEVITVEMKDVFTRYTNDVIATCAFGVNCDSLKQKENDFYVNARKATNFGGIKGLRIIIYQISPFITKLFGIKIVSTSVGNFFRKLINDSIQLREEKGIIRPDLIHLLMEAQKGRLEQESIANEKESFAVATEHITSTHSKNRPKSIITNEDITAQSLIFIFAGFDTSSTLLMFLAYELAVNKDIQDRLREEVQETLKNCNGKLTYEALMQMNYMDMVVSEGLRKWPPTIATDRVCSKDYLIEPERPHEKPLLLPKGSNIVFPIFGLQRDPVYYPDPEKFDPERFSSENKHNIHPSSFITFGVGPRNCIGSRFALMENKTILFHILSKFEFVPVEKSQIPLVLSKSHFTMQVEGGMWLGLKKLNHSITTTK